ncbi:MAG: VTT domain-containing protein [Salinibacterium sp.]|nr:VTT domain-containing protein [Salinibacterium sp.]MBF0672892.1 VTT domain-containing protein [Salinibacterium sp.]
MEQLTDAVLTLVGSPWLYLVVFAFAALDGLFPPVPSEAVLVAVAALVTAGTAANLVAVAAAAAIGALLGDATTHAVGSRIGVDRFRWMRSRRGAAAVGWARRRLQTSAAMAIVVGRYIPGGRVAVNLTAGATGMPRSRFLPIAALAAASWATYSVIIGLVAGHWAKDAPLLGAAVGVAIAIIIGIAIDQVLAQRSRAAARRQAALESDAVACGA